MRFGGTRRAAAAVAPRAAAQEHDHVPGRGRFAPHVFRRSRRDHRADFHVLGRVTIVINLVHNARRQADLIAIGTVARRRRGNQLFLRQLAGQRLRNRAQGIRRAGHAHGLVHIAAAGKGVANCAADTGGRAAEGFDLGRMVVRFVLKEQQPFLRFSVHVHIDLYGAGVDFLGFVEVGELARLFEIFGADGRHVHQRNGLAHAHRRAHGLIALKGSLRVRVVKGNVRKLRQKRGVPTVIRPIGIDHAQLCERGIALLRAEIGLAEFDVVLIHGQRVFPHQCVQRLLVQVDKALQRADVRRGRERVEERFRQIEQSFPALHRVDHMALDGRQFIGREIAIEHIQPRGFHHRPLALESQLHALRGAIRALVVLAGQIFHREHKIPVVRVIRRGVIELRLGKNGAHRAVEQILLRALHIVAVEQAQAFQGFNAQKRADILQKRIGFQREAGLFFDVYAIHHGLIPPLPAARAGRCPSACTRPRTLCRARPRKPFQ